ncbi:MAG TPA: ROK family protein, partial [Anaerolineales bacterium]|nr:ROK family protein [Anaerolineales bacterium]
RCAGEVFVWGGSGVSRTMTDQARYWLGLDVGGTKIAAGIVEFPSGNLVHKRVIPTRAERPGQEVLRDALTLVRNLMEETQAMTSPISGIGIGVCELVDLRGQVTSGYTVGWDALPVQECFTQLAPAIVEADVRAHALAEAMFGAGASFKTFVYVTVGTGISSSLVLDGVPFSGARGNALILASGPNTFECNHCHQLAEQVLENFASGPALAARFGVTKGEDVFAASQGGDARAEEVIRSAGAALGNSVGWLVNVLDPEAVIVGGGLGLAGNLYWQAFEASTRAHIWSDTTRPLPILPARLGVDAGLIGAACYAWKQFSQPH